MVTSPKNGFLHWFQWKTQVSMKETPSLRYLFLRSGSDCFEWMVAAGFPSYQATQQTKKLWNMNRVRSSKFNVDTRAWDNLDLKNEFFLQVPPFMKNSMRKPKLAILALRKWVLLQVTRAMKNSMSLPTLGMVSSQKWVQLQATQLMKD